MAVALATLCASVATACDRAGENRTAAAESVRPLPPMYSSPLFRASTENEPIHFDLPPLLDDEPRDAGGVVAAVVPPGASRRVGVRTAEVPRTRAASAPPAATAPSATTPAAATPSAPAATNEAPAGRAIGRYFIE